MHTTKRHSVIPASFVVVQNGDTILLQRRINTGYHDGDYETSAGHIEIGETAPVAGARELYEETGLIADPNDLELFHVITNDFETDNKPYLYLFFRIGLAACKGTFSIQEPEKCDDMRMFPVSELPIVAPHIAVALGSIGSKGVTFSSMAGQY